MILVPRSRLRPCGLVPAALPVERDLERVLDGERAALDEEQVRQRRVAQHPRERGDEVGVRGGVDVRVGRLVQRDLAELGDEAGVVGQAGVVEAQRRRREERVEVEVALTGPGVDDARAAAALEVDDEGGGVGQEVRGEHLVHLVRRQSGVSRPCRLLWSRTGRKISCQTGRARENRRVRPRTTRVNPAVVRPSRGRSGPAIGGRPAGTAGPGRASRPARCGRRSGAPASARAGRRRCRSGAGRRGGR